MCLVSHYTFSCKYKLSRRTNTYAWIIATATSRIVNKNRIVEVNKATVGMMVKRTNAAVAISCIRRWPAVRLAVSRTPKANGRINRLIVSIIIRIGIKGVGVPSGRR